MSITPMKAIRAKCLDCCCGQAREVKLCACESCPLYPYRMGHRPKSILRENSPGKTGVFEGAGHAPEEMPCLEQTR